MLGLEVATAEVSGSKNVMIERDCMCCVPGAHVRVVRRASARSAAIFAGDWIVSGCRCISGMASNCAPPDMSLHDDGDWRERVVGVGSIGNFPQGLVGASVRFEWAADDAQAFHESGFCGGKLGATVAFRCFAGLRLDGAEMDHANRSCSRVEPCAAKLGEPRLVCFVRMNDSLSGRSASGMWRIESRCKEWTS